MNRPQRLLHWHRDPHWYLYGMNAYHQCSCGARRVKWLDRFRRSPVDQGWPELRDSHDRLINDTGWRRDEV